MKIVHIILTHSFAGSERYAVELANLQAAQQHDVSIILHQRGCENRPNAIAQRVSDKVKIYQVSGFKLLAIYRARRLLKTLKPDVAHAHLSAACRVLHSLSGLCLRVATLHIHYKKQQHSKLDALIAIAPWQLAAIPENLKKHSIQLDNWSEARLPSTDARQRLRAQYGIAEQDIVFGTLGRVEESKGQAILLAAFLKAAIPNSRLVIVGNGKNWQKLRHQAPDSIIMPGFSNCPQDWLACFDVFVSAARTEPFGLVFLEAMHAKLPIIATASEGAKYLQPLFGNTLVSIDNIDQLAEQLQQYAKQLPQPDYPMQRFAPTAKVTEVLDFYQQQLNSRKA
ncbi:glycosyltransferase [Alishewanella sp. d11]|uniref:glycosyltransferase n=1 Tax=Alishewanella sp. d11 TaxID=3414030 RepID=UPI003BF7EC17